MPSGKILRKTTGAVAVGVFVLAQFATFAHSAFTSHRICPRHGEVVHQDTTALSAALPSKGWGDEAGEAVDFAGHFHGCVFTGCARSLSGPLPETGFRSMQDIAHGTEWVATGAAFRSLELLFLAPKHSPPSA